MSVAFDVSTFRVSPSVDEVTAAIERVGLAIVDGIKHESDVLQLAQRLGRIYRHRDSEASGLTRISNKMQESDRAGYDGFTGKALFPHTDRSCVPMPPALLIQVCAKQNARGGTTTLVDGRRMMGALKGQFPELWEEITAPAAARLDDGEHRYVGPLFEHLADNSVALRLRNDRFAYFSGPLSEHIPQLKDVINALTERFLLQPTEAYIINNRWWLHGRDRFEGEREMWRILVERDAPTQVGFPSLQ
jgi:alpha-ketoglutarate-dependent taurine dioxygenase